LFAITNAQPTVNNPSPLQINDKGTVIYENGTWKGGVWTPLTLSTTDQITNASARGINDSDMILGIGYDDAVSAFADYFAGLACYWPTPTDLPSIVEIGGESLVRAVNLETGTTSRDLFENSLCPGPVLASDGGFYFPKNRLKADRSGWIFENHSRWKLPSNGQPTPETSASPALRYSTGLGLQWGFDPARTEGSITAGGSIVGAATLPVLPYIPINVIAQPGASILAMPPSGGAEKSLIFINGAWKPSELHAIAIAVDGTTIGKSIDGLVTPVCINGRWIGIGRTAPDLAASWKDGTVKLTDTTPRGWILAQRSDGSENRSSQSAVMLPLRGKGLPKDETLAPEATGVDAFSIGAKDSGDSVDHKIWIMATSIAGATDVIIDSPLSPAIPLRISAAGIRFNGGDEQVLTAPSTSFTLESPGTTVASGTEIPLDLKLGEAGTSESPATPVDSISFPIAVKVMKARAVRIPLYKVTKETPNIGNVPVPDNPPALLPPVEGLQAYLNAILESQINADTIVTYAPDTLKLNWDSNGNGSMDPTSLEDVGPGLQAILDARPGIRAESAIDVFLLGTDKKMAGNSAWGITNRSVNACWVVADTLENPADPESGRDIGELSQTIAHEIGHILTDYGHPDQNSGPSPLPGTDRRQRLLFSGEGLKKSGRHLHANGPRPSIGEKGVG
jgi:hypothetical protein